MPTAKQDAAIVVESVRKETIAVPIRGVRPLILNRVSEKAKRELLFPAGGRKTAADRAASLKHDPPGEFRAAPYTLTEEDAPTYLAGLASWFKNAMMDAALDMPGAKKTQIGRLLWVEGERVPIYGVPEIFLTITRSADIQRTPDVRTRCIVPAWAAIIEITYVVPLLNERSVLNLLAAAGMICGVGDWRPQKGKGTYGQFILTNPDDDAAFVQTMQTGGRAAQLAAMANPGPYDDESEELLAWFDTELERRGKSNGKTAKAGVLA